MPLTELAIKHLKPKDKTFRISDGNGLCIEVMPTGSKHWRWRYYYLGKEQMLALGRYPTISLAQARKKRDEAYGLLASGKHPAREKKIEKLRKVHEGENSFERVARRWLEVKKENLNPNFEKQTLARLERHVFPKIGTLPIGDITIPDVVGVVEGIGKGGTIEMAKRMKQVMAQVFRYAAQRGLCVQNPAGDLRDLLPTRQQKHFACINPREITDLLNKIESRKDDFTKYAIKLLMLTFVRTGELIGAKWEEIDWEKKEWHIPKERMKMKRSHVVPLSSQAIALLKELHEITGSKAFLFHSPSSKSMHISNGTVLMGLRRMGYKNKMTGHGFRTLASTILNEQGFAPDIIERQLAHEDADKIRAAYNRAEYLHERKKMMQDYSDFLTCSQQAGKILKFQAQ